MTKFEEAKKLMELLGIPFEENKWAVWNNSINIGQQQAQMAAINAYQYMGQMPGTLSGTIGFGQTPAGTATTTGNLTYTQHQGNTGYCYTCNSSNCTFYTQPNQSAAYCYVCNSNTCICYTQATQYPYGNVGGTYAQGALEQVPHATIDIEKLYDLLSDDEKLKEIISKLKMKAFW